MSLQQLMQSLAQDLDVGTDFHTEHEGLYQIPLDEKIFIKVSSQPGGALLSCDISPIPETKREEFLQHLLHGNLFGQGTHGAVLGVSPEGDRVILSKEISEGIDYKVFKALVEDFINMVDYWSNVVPSNS